MKWMTGIDKKSFFVISLVSIFHSCIVNVPIVSVRGPLEEITVLGEGKNKIALINISGVISWEERESGILTKGEPSIVSRIKEELDKARTDERVKGVILKVDSPGGLISASEIIYQEIKKFKSEKNIPIVSYIPSIGASGAYYIITPSDKIIASPGSTVGSIGVYLIKVNIKGLSEKIGVDFEVIKAGKHKDALLFNRGLTDEEREKIQNKINYYYESFKKVVVEGRGERLKRTIDEIADGSVFTPQEALEIGLIDQIGDIYSAIEQTAKIAGIKDYRVVMYIREGMRIHSIWEETYSKQNQQDFIKQMVIPGIYMLYLYPADM